MQLAIGKHNKHTLLSAVVDGSRGDVFLLLPQVLLEDGASKN